VKSAAQPPRPATNNLLPRLFPFFFGAFLALSFLKFGNPPIMENWVTPPTNTEEFIFGYPWPMHWGFRLLALVALMGVGTYAIQSVKRRTQMFSPGSAAKDKSDVTGRKRERIPNAQNIIPPPDRRPLSQGKSPGEGNQGAEKRARASPKDFTLWLAILPIAWLLWQFLAATQTADIDLTKVTLKHFAASVVCFYLGYFCLSQYARPTGFWLPLIVAFALVLIAGWDQHFGGIEETRRYFFLYIYPTLTEVPEGYLKKISSSRIWGTLFYPNALAGVILLLLPMALGFIWSLRRRFTEGARILLLGLLGVPALACLYWSQSKGGWLLLLLVILVASLFLPWKRQLKLFLVGAALVLGLAGFFWKHSSFFQKGATSVAARFDYWRAAIATASKHPLIGTGPGTFAISYKKIKRPESEMSRLVHNDYLQQASDSGLPGFFAYGLLVLGGLACTYPAARAAAAINHGGESPDRIPLFIWLGLFSWALHGIIEFDLYIPAISWPAFTLLGFLIGKPRIIPSTAPGAHPTVPSK
jgi:O-antigen ligase